MTKHQLLTDEELAMLRDLGNDEDIATSQYLRGTLPLPLQTARSDGVRALIFRKAENVYTKILIN